MAADSEGRLPLHIAAQEGHEAVVRLLLEAAPQAAAAVSELGTPLQLALGERHTAAAHALRCAGGHLVGNTAQAGGGSCLGARESNAIT